MPKKIGMNAREAEFFNDACRRGLRLEYQVPCCNNQYRVDFVGRTPDGRRVPIELIDSNRGSLRRAREIREEFGISIIEIDYSRYRLDPAGTILNLQDHLQRI
jgi:hypothetical protein